MKKKTMDLTRGPVLKQLILFVWPIFVGSLLQTLYNTADRIVVGQFAGSNALAAVGSVGYPVNVLLGLLGGFSTSANVIVSNFLGGRKENEARKAAHTAIMVALIGGVVVMLLGVLFSEAILEFMNTPKKTIHLSALYMRIIFCGVPVSMLYNFGAAVMRSYGDAKRPMMIVSISGIVNVVLNLVFVLVFHMSVAGVALATIAAQAVTAVWVMWLLMDPKGEFRLTWKEMKLYPGITRNMVRTGIPMGFSSSMLHIGGLAVQSSINSFGPAVMAGSAASDSVTSVTAVLIGAVFSGCVSFAGQNYGAGNYKRLDQLFVSTTLLGGGLAAVLALICTVFSTQLLSLINPDPATIAAGFPKSVFVGWGYVFHIISQAGLGICRGMKKAAIPTYISVFSLCIVRLIWVWVFFPLHPTVTMLYVCFPLSFLCNMIGHTTYYLICRKKLLKKKIPV